MCGIARGQQSGIVIFSDINLCKIWHFKNENMNIPPKKDNIQEEHIKWKLWETGSRFPGTFRVVSSGDRLSFEQQSSWRRTCLFLWKDGDERPASRWRQWRMTPRTRSFVIIQPSLKNGGHLPAKIREQRNNIAYEQQGTVIAAPGRRQPYCTTIATNKHLTHGVT